MGTRINDQLKLCKESRYDPKDLYNPIYDLFMIYGISNS